MDVTNKKKSVEHDNDWLPCAPGMIVGPEISLQARFAKRKATLFQLGAIYFCGGLIAISICISLLSAPNRETPPPLAHTMNCTEVQRMLCDYAGKSVRCCQKRASITQHLTYCPECDLCYQQMIDNGFSPSIRLAAQRLVFVEEKTQNEIVTPVTTELNPMLPQK